MKKLIAPVKGTRDFYPEQMALRTWLYGRMRQVSESFGYQEYEAPILEPLELYAAKSGEELVGKQSYAFKDRGGSEITLRPELTPSLARMIAQRQNDLVFPVRWWSFGPFWRYERPQKGRSREFFQWNVDLLGVDSAEADAEVVAVLASFLRLVGISPTQVEIRVGSRRMLDELLAAMEVAKSGRAGAAAWIDQRGKLGESEWREAGKSAGLTGPQIRKVEAFLEDTDAWKRQQDLTRLFASLDAYGLADYVRFDPAVVRGLAYYTGTVFEAWEVGGEVKRAVLGGGRYDNLLAAVGGAPLPAVGFAMGDVVIGLVLKEYGLLPAELGAVPAQVLVTVFDEERLPAAYSLAKELRAAGLKVATYPAVAKLQKQFKYADRIGVSCVLVIGPDEAARDEVLLKDLKSGDQQSVARRELADALKRRLDDGAVQ